MSADPIDQNILAQLMVKADEFAANYKGYKSHGGCRQSKAKDTLMVKMYVANDFCRKQECYCTIYTNGKPTATNETWTRAFKTPYVSTMVSYLFSEHSKIIAAAFEASDMVGKLLRIVETNVSDVVDLTNGKLSIQDFDSIPDKYLGSIRKVTTGKKCTYLEMIDKLEAAKLLVIYQEKAKEKAEQFKHVYGQESEVTIKFKQGEAPKVEAKEPKSDV